MKFKKILSEFILYLDKMMKTGNSSFESIVCDFIKDKDIKKLIIDEINNDFWGNNSFNNTIKRLKDEKKALIFYRQIYNLHSNLYIKFRKREPFKGEYNIEAFTYKRDHKDLPSDLSGFISGIYRQ